MPADIKRRLGRHAPSASRSAHEFLTQYPADEIGQGIRRPAPIVYRENGNRAVRGRDFLQRIEPLLPRLGITRIAEISQLLPHDFPVFQSCRPNIFAHPKVGQNSGSQGKGITRTQAKISCIMETVESYCMEPWKVRLIKGTYVGLRAQHILVRPRYLFRNSRTASPKDTEPLMWAEAYSVEQDKPLLVPAETIFFPFAAQFYGTRSIYPRTSNGVAAGSNYLEAVLHGLYEVIERFYRSCLCTGEAAVKSLFEEDEKSFNVRGFNERMKDELTLRLYSLTLPRSRNLPMVLCLLVGREGIYAGFGCSSDVDAASSRAISEAIQSHSTAVSGSREDIASHSYDFQDFGFTRCPSQRTLRIRDYKRRVGSRRYKDLRAELKAAISWVHSIGYPSIFIANLTRVGIELPTVRVLIPGMPIPFDMRRGPATARHPRLEDLLFPTLGKTR